MNIKIEPELKNMCKDCWQFPCICSKFDDAIKAIKDFRPIDPDKTVSSVPPLKKSKK